MRVEEAAAGRGGIVLVSGDAGVGKTAVVEQALSAGHAVFRDGGYEHAAAPYAPLVAVLRAYERSCPGALERSGPLSRCLAPLFPELWPDPVDSDTGVAEALVDAVRELGAGDAALVLLDDLHVADAATLELLPALAVALRDRPVLIVG
ncbi:MAG: hypothetical protein QOE87_4617, partial [Gaiellales bacterium]|nr:hypothetical protein [Gaiellales bacterium]